MPFPFLKRVPIFPHTFNICRHVPGISYIKALKISTQIWSVSLRKRGDGMILVQRCMGWLQVKTIHLVAITFFCRVHFLFFRFWDSVSTNPSCHLILHQFPLVAGPGDVKPFPASSSTTASASTSSTTSADERGISNGTAIAYQAPGTTLCERFRLFLEST